jgi:sugar O-acyltransferase (sialic acid O-acetyltransferase NeuD family)
MKPLYIIGTSGFAKEVGQLAGLINATQSRWNRIEYLAEDERKIGAELPYGRVTSTDDLLSREEEADIAIGIGRPKIRQSIAENLLNRPWLSAPNLIHPRSQFDPNWAQLGKGNILTCGTVFTCDIVVGDFNVFNLNCTIGHDVRIGSYSVINPGCNISGGIQLGDRCLLGTGVQIIENLSIVSDTTVGAGALVSKSITEPGTYVGVPARALK